MLRTSSSRSLSKVARIVCGPLDTNCYLFGTPERCLVVDPAAPSPALDSAIRTRFPSAAVDVFLTHGHFDHIGGVDSLIASHPRARIYITSADLPLLSDASLNLSASVGGALCVRSLGARVHTVGDGDTIDLGGGDALRVLALPGHTRGSAALLHARAGLLFAGDTLFRGSVGRTDLPGGDSDALRESVAAQLLPLPDDVAVLPGHGELTTIGDERKHNPFMRRRR